MFTQKHGVKGILDSTIEKYPQLQEEYDKIRLFEPVITNALQNAAKEHDLDMKGLEYSIKTASSVSNKMNRRLSRNPNTNLLQDTRRMKDICRYTMITDKEHFHEKVLAVIKQLEKQGFNACRCINYFSEPYEGTGYKGLHYNFLDQTGHYFELQFHTPESFDAKMEGHKIYELTRDVNNPETYNNPELLENVKNIHGAVENPKNCEDIHPFETPENLSITGEYNIQRTDKEVSYEIICNDKTFITGVEQQVGEHTVGIRYYSVGNEVKKESYDITPEYAHMNREVHDSPTKDRITDPILSHDVDRIIALSMSVDRIGDSFRSLDPHDEEFDARYELVKSHRQEIFDIIQKYKDSPDAINTIRDNIRQATSAGEIREDTSKGLDGLCIKTPSQNITMSLS